MKQVASSNTSDAQNASNPLNTLLRWFDAHASLTDSAPQATQQKVDWLRVMPFLFMHLMCLGVIWVGWSPFAVIVAFALYFLRMLAITGFYHRYFSHKSFKTSRAMQFIFAVLGASAAQRGPLWWASHHRHHHIHSDKETDAHSPKQHGFFWSHMGWFMSNDNFAPKFQRIPDLVKFRELVWLDRFDALVPVALAVALYILGEGLANYVPSLNTNGAQLLIWGFFVSTVFLYHATYTVNSLAHQIGKRRYKTRDDSRNSMLIALITCGEGWHNNHHHFPGSARQGFYWWEIDMTFYFLKLLAATGLIWDLKAIPSQLKNSRLINKR
ncbi:MAG: stearoyl-CoA 9-desaturase [Gammaproteobacteria bacterium SG8_15]|nr:MAG: stearoyl-CoA 9-desaturase [Gammaproteobacteria bacterium SG8_15]